MPQLAGRAEPRGYSGFDFFFPAFLTLLFGGIFAFSLPSSESGDSAIQASAALWSLSRQRLAIVTLDGALHPIHLGTPAPETVHSYRWSPNGERLAFDTSDLYVKLRRLVVVDATDLGLAPATPEDLAGGDAAVNADIARRVLSGEAGPKRDIVVLNAAAGLLVAGLSTDLAGGVVLAQASIDDGHAAAKLAALDNESVLKQPALIQIRDQCGGGLVGI